MPHDYRKARPEIGVGEAEQDVRRFRSAFIKLSTYAEIANSSIVFISGRKGSGKSALCIEFEESESDNYSYLFSMKKESLDYYNFRSTRSRLLKEYGSEEDIRYLTRQSWYLTILINLMIFVCKEQDSVVDIDIERMKIFLTEGKWYDFGNNRRILAFVAKIIDYFTKSNVASEAEAALSDYIMNNDSLLSAISALKAFLARQEMPVLMLIDDIDAQLSSITSEEERRNALAYIDGLVNSCQALRYPFLSDNFHIKAFVPQDLFSQVKERHSDKIAASSRNVTWQKSELLRMIVARLHDNLPEKLRAQFALQASEGISQTWAYFFPEKIYVSDSRLRAPHPFDSHKVILSYTLQRPRDLIVLCDQIFHEVRNNNEAFITEKTIWEAINRYSILLVKSLTDEYSSVYLGIEDIIQSFAHGKRKYTKAELTVHFNNIPQVGGGERQINSLIDTLYSSGFLGVVRTIEENEPAPGHPETREEFYYDRLNVTAHQSDEFVIHRAFGKALQIQMGMGVR